MTFGMTDALWTVYGILCYMCNGAQQNIWGIGTLKAIIQHCLQYPAKGFFGV